MQKKRVLFYMAELLCAAVFIYAAAQLLSIYKDYHQASEEYSALSLSVVTEIPLDHDEMEVEGTNAEEMKQVEFHVDLGAVKAKNADTAGWIILPDSKINYPVVKSADNEDYLRTTFDRKPATAGTLFIDMNCKADFSDRNTIIYGHNMKDGSMFRALNSLTDREYFNNHQTFLISTGGELEEYQIISCYETTTDNVSSWQISFESDETYAEWLKNAAARCTYKCMPYDVGKNTITLSTCRGKSGGTGRFIVHLQQKKTEGGDEDV